MGFPLHARTIAAITGEAPHKHIQMSSIVRRPPPAPPGGISSVVGVAMSTPHSRLWPKSRGRLRSAAGSSKVAASVSFALRQILMQS